MGRWADIRTRVVRAVGDITTTTAQQYVLDAAQHLNAEARWLEATVSIGTTTAGTGQYDIPDTVIDFYSVLVGGQPYDRASIEEIEGLDAGYGTLYARWPNVVTGVFAPSFSSTGDLKLEIRPVPTTSGVAISGRRILPITVADWANEDPSTPADFDKDIILGATALGLMENDDRFAEGSSMWDRFDQGAVRRLKARKSGRVGKGAITMSLKRRG